MQVQVVDRLACFLAVGAEDLVLQLVDLLQLAADLVRCHEQIDALNLGELLQPRSLPSGADKHMACRVRLVVNHCENILAK